MEQFSCCCYWPEVTKPAGQPENVNPQTAVSRKSRWLAAEQNYINWLLIGIGKSIQMRRNVYSFTEGKVSSCGEKRIQMNTLLFAREYFFLRNWIGIISCVEKRFCENNYCEIVRKIRLIGVKCRFLVKLNTYIHSLMAVLILLFVIVLD